MAVTYALDVTNERVQKAMAVLGIEDSELIVKYCARRTPDDFGGPHISDDIQNLRYTYYRKKLDETKKKIRYQIREDRQRQPIVGESVSVRALRAPHSLSRDYPKTVSLASFLQLEEEKLKKAKEKHRKSIVKLLEQSKSVTPKAVRTAEDEESPQQEALQRRKEQFEKRQQRHQQKLEEIQKAKIQRQRELLQQINLNMQKHEDRGRKLEEEKRLMQQERARSFQERQQDIMRKVSEREESIERDLQKRLEAIEQRITKNRDLHTEAMRKKAEIAAKTVEKATAKTSKFDSLRSADEVERIKQYITAQQQARERKHDLTSEQILKFEESRKRAEEKMARIKELQHKEKTEENRNLRRLENKMKSASMVLERKQRDWQKELELRLEMQRLMDEDKRTKVERAQRRYVFLTQNVKRTKLLEKLVQERDKAELQRRELYLKETKHQETAIKIMIDKERATEVQGLVTKSPLARSTQEKLSAMEIKVAAEEKAEEVAPSPPNP